MDREKTSKTEKESYVEERLFNLGDHYKTTIKNGEHKVEGRGRTPEEAEEVASEKWDEDWDEDEDDE